jgi:hypothetical protein
LCIDGFGEVELALMKMIEVDDQRWGVTSCSSVRAAMYMLPAICVMVTYFVVSFDQAAPGMSSDSNISRLWFASYCYESHGNAVAWCVRVIVAL